MRAVRAVVDAVHRLQSARTSCSPSTSPARTTEWHAIVASTWSSASLTVSVASLALSSPSTSGQHLGRIGRRQQIGQRAHRHRRLAEALQLEAERRQAAPRARPPPPPAPAPAPPSPASSSRCDGTALSPVRLAQPLEGDALVRGVLIDEHQLARRLTHEIRAMQLPEIDERREEAALLGSAGRRRRARRRQERVGDRAAACETAARPAARTCASPPRRAAAARRSPSAARARRGGSSGGSVKTSSDARAATDEPGPSASQGASATPRATAWRTDA